MGDQNTFTFKESELYNCDLPHDQEQFRMQGQTEQEQKACQ